MSRDRSKIAGFARVAWATVLLPVLIAVPIAFFLPSDGEALAEGKPTPAQKEAELQRVKARIEKVRASVNRDIEKRDKLTAELRSAEMAAQAASKELDEIRAKRIAAESRRRDLEEEAAVVEKELAGERNALAGELRAAYVNGHAEQIKLLLNQEDPASFGRMLAYYGYFGRARADRIQGIRDKLAHLALVREDIDTETRQLALLEEQQQQEVEQLRLAKERRSSAMSGIDRQIKSQGGELERLRSQSNSLEKLIQDLRKALETSRVEQEPPFEPLRGQLPWPVQDGKVLARFGQPRAGGSLRWQGMLIGTPRGARVRAPFKGRVVYADWLPGMGLMVVIDHGGGYMSLYGHNQEVYGKVGQSVAAGDVIGAVGDSGGHNQPALYFEVRQGRKPVNPENWLKRR
jgi:septal ring factor EnvC (AmiA/AmiB activator)